MRKGWLLALLVALALALCAHAAAEGVEIAVTQDKPSHEANEIATLTIDITNHTEMVLRNFRIQNLIPAGLEYVDSAEAQRVIDAIQPGASARHVIRLRKVVIPKTGDAAHPLLWGLLALACAAYLTRRARARRPV